MKCLINGKATLVVFTIDSEKEIEFELRNINGESMFKSKTRKGDYFDITNMGNGMYTIHFDEGSVQKIVKGE